MTSIKRQKTSNQCSDDPVVLNLASLPAEIFNGITSYLTNTSCALLGVSLTAPSSSTLWRDGSSSASLRQKLSTASTFILSSIIARGGDTKLDLYNNMKDKILKKNISDEDIHALLMFINAPEKLKRLQFRLKGTNVTGTCFEPLRGSRVIEQIIAINYDRTTSQEIILPILMSIVRTDGNSLQHVQLPYIHGRRELLDNFRVEYNNLLASRDSHCKNCEGDVETKVGYLGLRQKEVKSLHASTVYRTAVLFGTVINVIMICAKIVQYIGVMVVIDVVDALVLQENKHVKVVHLSRTIVHHVFSIVNTAIELDVKLVLISKNVKVKGVIKSTVETALMTRSAMWLSAVKPIVMQVQGSVGIAL